jgi:hypothetical protein
MLNDWTWKIVVFVSMSVLGVHVQVHIDDHAQCSVSTPIIHVHVKFRDLLDVFLGSGMVVKMS